MICRRGGCARAMENGFDGCLRVPVGGEWEFGAKNAPDDTPLCGD